MAARLCSILLLSVALIAAPLAPAFGAMADRSMSRHADHVMKQDADDSGVQTHHAGMSCSQKGACDGQCCSFCAQCHNAVFFVFPDYDHSHPVQAPVAMTFLSRILVDLPQRPPSVRAS